MDSVVLLSKFKDSLGSIINDYKGKIAEIESKEDFMQVLSDLVNYSKSDALLLPFYDETLLSNVFDVVFPLSNSQMSKLKTAKYLIESSKDVDKSHFPQYNNAVMDLTAINDDIVKYYDNLVSSNTYSADKENYNLIIDRYSSIYDLIGEDNFLGLIDDVDLFHDVMDECKLNNSDINGILNIAILSNLSFLNDNGIVDVQVDANDKLKEATRDLSNLINSSL